MIIICWLLLISINPLKFKPSMNLWAFCVCGWLHNSSSFEREKELFLLLLVLYVDIVCNFSGNHTKQNCCTFSGFKILFYVKRKMREKFLSVVAEWVKREKKKKRYIEKRTLWVKWLSLHKIEYPMCHNL